MELYLVIPGRPFPKGRPRGSFRNGHLVFYTPKATKEAEKYISVIGKKIFKHPLEGEVEMDITFYFKGNRKKIPDLDNLVKLTCDGLNKVAYKDDSQIKKLNASIQKDPMERTELVIREVEPVG